MEASLPANSWTTAGSHRALEPRSGSKRERRLMVSSANDGRDSPLCHSRHNAPAWRADLPVLRLDRYRSEPRGCSPTFAEMAAQGSAASHQKGRVGGSACISSGDVRRVVEALGIVGSDCRDRGRTRPRRMELRPARSEHACRYGSRTDGAAMFRKAAAETVTYAAG